MDQACDFGIIFFSADKLDTDITFSFELRVGIRRGDGFCRRRLSHAAVLQVLGASIQAL